jgi:beta-lactamase regulating signal transducer with metallopeptidase domain
MLEFFTQSTWMERMGWVLVHSLWQFTLVGLMAAVFQQAFVRRQASLRYRTLLSAMFLTAVLPAATWFSLGSGDAPTRAVMIHAPETPVNVYPLPDRDGSYSRAVQPAESLAEPAATSPRERVSSESPPSILVSTWLLTKQWFRPWLGEIAFVWFAGVLLAAIRPSMSWRRVRRLRTAGVSPVDSSVQEVLECLFKRLGISRDVEVLQSTLVNSPGVIGHFRPVVLLPLCVITGLSAKQLELVLAHELAHVRRHDYLVNMLQTLVETLFFYHPAVWWLSRQVRNERENCCDDAAMATVGSRADYGRTLLAIEELRAKPTVLSPAAHGGSLVARIQRIAGCGPAPRFAGIGSVLGVMLFSAMMYFAVTGGAAPPEEGPEGTPAASTVQATAEASGTIEPPSLDRRAAKEIWSLALKDAIRSALHNSKVARQIGVQVVRLPKSSMLNPGAAPSGDNPTEAIPGGNERVLIARLNTDITLANFEAGVRNLVSDVEMAYWELYYAHSNLDAALTALETWRKVYARRIKGTKGGAAADEAQAREQYFFFRRTGEQALSDLYAAEGKLRYLMGLAASDGRLIRPSDEPTTAKVTFDWAATQAEALRRSVEIRQQKGRVRRRELELAAAKEYAASQGDRRKNAGLRNAELALAKERATFQEAELELSHQVAYALRDLEAKQVICKTNLNSLVAVRQQLKALDILWVAGTTPQKGQTLGALFSTLLEAQRTLVQAECTYYNSLIQYNKAIMQVHFRKGSLLEQRGVYLAEESKPNE